MEKQQKIIFGLGWIAGKIKAVRATRKMQNQKNTYYDGSHFLQINQATFIRSLQ